MIKLWKEYQKLLTQKLQMLEDIIKIENEYLSTMPIEVVKAKRSNERKQDAKLLKLTKNKVEQRN